MKTFLRCLSEIYNDGAYCVLFWLKYVIGRGIEGSDTKIGNPY